MLAYYKFMLEMKDVLFADYMAPDCHMSPYTKSCAKRSVEIQDKIRLLEKRLDQSENGLEKSILMSKIKQEKINRLKVFKEFGEERGFCVSINEERCIAYTACCPLVTNSTMMFKYLIKIGSSKRTYDITKRCCSEDTVFFFSLYVQYQIGINHIIAQYNELLGKYKKLGLMQKQSEKGLKTLSNIKKFENDINTVHHGYSIIVCCLDVIV